MRSDRTAGGGSNGSTSIGALALLAFTFVAGYLLGQRRSEQSWQAPEDHGGGVAVEIAEDTSIPGESLIGDDSEPGKEVPDAGEIRTTPDPEEVNGSSDAETKPANDDAGTAPPEMEAQTPEAETAAEEEDEESGESAGAEAEETDEEGEATEDSEDDDGHDDEES